MTTVTSAVGPWSGTDGSSRWAGWVRYRVPWGTVFPRCPTPTVSVVIPIFNGLPYLQQTVDSVLAQTYPDVELVLVDGGSTDGSREWVEAFEHPAVVKDYLPAGTPAADTWTRASELATGDYVKLLCQDDLIHPDAVALQVADLEAYPTAGMAIAQRDMISASGKVLFHGARVRRAAERSRRRRPRPRGRRLAGGEHLRRAAGRALPPRGDGGGPARGTTSSPSCSTCSSTPRCCSGTTSSSAASPSAPSASARRRGPPGWRRSSATSSAHGSGSSSRTSRRSRGTASRRPALNNEKTTLLRRGAYAWLRRRGDLSA